MMLQELMSEGLEHVITRNLSQSMEGNFEQVDPISEEEDDDSDIPDEWGHS